ncbi:testis-specific serine/threonine-protein kinase 3-like [Adelges cooleyi]|uniref:testis-specific serine/threonine-protein kinase 3-like n=1 Tax=Adelges cooleyi TaxID=133065 RepID=UPI0021802A31|nr:testis-specific serine/threonine-protein kinase 3-like [Adelges cooleyi]
MINNHSITKLKNTQLKPESSSLNRFVGENYQSIVRKIGEGAFSSVYLSEIKTSQNKIVPVACKVISLAGWKTEEYVKTFLPREIDIMTKIRHINIIRVYGIVQYKKCLFINMRYAEHGNVLEFLDGKTLNELQARVWTKQLTTAVHYLHELNMVHRDIKCENILVTAKLNVKLTDFGFSRIIPGDDYRSRTYCGSIHYCAPEILRGKPYDAKLADIWSLGVVLFAMINNVKPFNANKREELIALQMQKNWSFRSEVEPSPKLADLLNRILEPKPEKRITAAEVLQSQWMKSDILTSVYTDQELLDVERARAQKNDYSTQMTTRLAQNFHNVNYYYMKNTINNSLNFIDNTGIFENVLNDQQEEISES